MSPLKKLIALVGVLSLSLTLLGAAPAVASDVESPSAPPAEPAGDVDTQVVPVLWAVGMAVVRVGATTAVKRTVVVKATSATAARTAARRAMVTAGATVKSVGVAGRASMRSFTARNLRHNLSVRTGGTRVNYQAHHRLPQRFRDDFRRMGITDIDNPRYALWWCARSHLQHAAKYNASWERFFDEVRDNPKLGGRANTLREMDRLTRLYSHLYACPAGTRTPV